MPRQTPAVQTSSTVPSSASSQLRLSCRACTVQLPVFQSQTPARLHWSAEEQLTFSHRSFFFFHFLLLFFFFLQLLDRWLAAGAGFLFFCFLRFVFFTRADTDPIRARITHSVVISVITTFTIICQLRTYTSGRIASSHEVADANRVSTSVLAQIFFFFVFFIFFLFFQF